jgi:hypothetical protein
MIEMGRVSGNREVSRRAKLQGGVVEETCGGSQQCWLGLTPLPKRENMLCTCQLGNSNGTCRGRQTECENVSLIKYHTYSACPTEANTWPNLFAFKGNEGNEVADLLAKEGAEASGAEYLPREEESIASLRLPMWPAALQKRNRTST